MGVQPVPAEWGRRNPPDRRGNRYVRRLIIHGARSCYLHLNRANQAIGRWLSALEARTHHNKAVVALANKLMRIVWAILISQARSICSRKGRRRTDFLTAHPIAGDVMTKRLIDHG